MNKMKAGECDISCFRSDTGNCFILDIEENHIKSRVVFLKKEFEQFISMLNSLTGAQGHNA